MVSVTALKRAHGEVAGAVWAGAAVSPAFVLKIDVDTHEGLRDGAPRLLELLQRRGVKATWFVSMGPDRTGRAILRVFRQRGFLQKMLRSRAPRLYPWRTMLRGTLLPAISVVRTQPERLRAIAAAGHEVGIHGFDHVRWHDRLAALPDGEVRAEVSRALRCFEDILGFRPQGFAAPGWQCTAASLRAVDALGFRYRSDTRGVRPYRPRIAEYVSSIPEVPTSLPTLDEVLGRAGSSRADLVGAYLGWLDPEGINVHTVHTEVEGGLYLGQLDALLERVADVLPLRTLGDLVADLPPIDRLPTSWVRRGRLPGRGGTVACQAQAC
jgi:peptidoglycan/xylan/chitin deacetylase (PgdA/CDA1 family)